MLWSLCWDSWSSSHPQSYPSLGRKLSCPGVSPGSGTHGQGPSFLWANLGFWALTPEQEADGSDLGWSIFKGRTLQSLEMWVPNVGILGEGDQRLGQGWGDYTTSRARVCWLLLFFHLPLRWEDSDRGRVFPFPCLSIPLERLHLPPALELGCWEGR